MKKVVELITEYQRNYLTYEALTKELKNLFEALLTSNNIGFLQIETRVKSLPSFLDKVYRLIASDRYKGQTFADLVGIRLITYYNEDVYEIARLVEQQFTVHAKNSEYESHNRSPDQFGYSSLHYKVSLSPDKPYFHALEKFQNILFEVQIRTVAQHAWAAIDHKIRYKTAEQIPQDVQREIFRLSALFELADNQFLSIKKKLEARAREELKKYKAGDSSVKINALTLDHFFETHRDAIESIVQQAREIGFQKTSIQHDPNSIRYLLMLFQRLGIVTIDDLEELFVEAQAKGMDIMHPIYQAVSDENIDSIDYPFPIVLLIVIALRLKKTRFDHLNAGQLIQQVLGSSVKSISLSLENQ
ncbi:MAG: hypothetical protein GXO76_10220 [Calditrichaeota bacterium]|nr:hypothetical protein [Calditrichota bacterium]